MNYSARLRKQKFGKRNFRISIKDIIHFREKGNIDIIATLSYPMHQQTVTNCVSLRKPCKAKLFLIR